MSIKYGLECGSTNDFPNIKKHLEQSAIRSLFEVAAFRFTLEKGLSKENKLLKDRINFSLCS